jgi:oligosaccharide repeat unit polymerase
MNQLRRVIISFFIVYVSLIITSLILYKMDFPPFEYIMISILFYLILILSMYVGSFYQNKNHLSLTIISVSNLEKIIQIFYLLALISILVSWIIVLKNYDGIDWVIKNANSIRNSTIGLSESVVPVFLSYLSSLIYVVWVYELARWRDIGTPRYLRLISIFILIFLVDLLSFGRVGLFFSLTTAFCYFISVKKKFNYKPILVIFLIFIVAMFPRMLRGDFDNFEGTVIGYRPYFRFDIPEYFNIFMSIIPYFTGSFISGPKMIYLSNFTELNLGEKTFTPIFNLIYKFIDFDRVSTIDDFASIPYDHNVHGLLWDLYRDFGYFGSIVAVLFFGFLLGCLPSFANGRLRNAMIYFIGGVLYFSPIYSLFSVGGFFIAFLIILFLIISFLNVKIVW